MSFSRILDNDNDLLAHIVEQTRALVRIPSQAFHDPLDHMLEFLTTWCRKHGVPGRTLTDATGKPTALLLTIDSGKPGPRLCLDACIDTAPIGSRHAWSADPFAGTLAEGRLYGRGVADSKTAVAIFCHLARTLSRSETLEHGVLYVLLDGDEHTGHFGGVRAFLEHEGASVDFVAIGYPGNEKLVIGARGFYRARLRTFGTEVHSGSSTSDTSQNAVLKMARLVSALSLRPLPAETDPDFGFGPSLAITEVHGGSGFSQIPGLCEAKVDVRLTPGFDAQAARSLVSESLARIDREFPTRQPSELDEVGTWPWYKLDRNARRVRILQDCAERVFGRDVPLVVCGPSNIGNYLATRRLPATCGFGVTYGNIHAPDEWVSVDSIVPVYDTYLQAVRRWSDPGTAAGGQREMFTDF